jgi:hypothetical protein
LKSAENPIISNHFKYEGIIHGHQAHLLS